MGQVRACLNPLKAQENGNERNGTKMLVVIRSDPMQKKVFGSIMQNPGPRQPNQYQWYLLHMPRQIGVHTHLRCCPSTSNEVLFVPVRSGRSVLPTKKRGATLLLPLPRYAVFSGRTEYIHWFS